MGRYRACPLCGSSHFTRVLIRLPSGRDRVTDFEACEKCTVVFFQPELGPVERFARPNYREHIPASVAEAIVKALPDPALETTAPELRQYYQHPDLGRMTLLFKRMQKADGGPFFWHLDDAKPLG